MWPFWETAIEPMLSSSKARTIVEIGAEYGLNTGRLLEWAAANRAVVHSIDPQPLFDVQAFRRQYGKTFVMHTATSLEALPHIKRIDALLIDGDHNWYTVFNELKLIDRKSRKWPITCLHDLMWPYGRRDMYYAPKLIPSEFRHPYDRGGVVEGRSSLSAKGENAGLCHAEHEGGPRNGVLTAVEDFIRDSDRVMELLVVRGPGGLGLLLDHRQLKSQLGQVVRRIYDPAFARVLTPDHASSYFEAAASA